MNARKVFLFLVTLVAFSTSTLSVAMLKSIKNIGEFLISQRAVITCSGKKFYDKIKVIKLFKKVCVCAYDFNNCTREAKFTHNEFINSYKCPVFVSKKKTEESDNKKIKKCEKIEKEEETEYKMGQFQALLR